MNLKMFSNKKKMFLVSLALLICMSLFPYIYKYRCSFNFPLRNLVTKEYQLIDKIKVPISTVLTYEHTVHESVGYMYSSVYDEDAFEEYTSKEYEQVQIFGMCGGDRALKKTELKTLKRGDFLIKIVHSFRYEVKSVECYSVHVY